MRSSMSFPSLGQRTMCLNARQVFYEGGANTTILLGIEDITERRILEREKDELLRQKGRAARRTAAPGCQQPANHRKHPSDEGACGAVGRDAYPSARRASSVSCRSLPCRSSSMHPEATGSIEIAPYLTRLCDSLATSMIGDTRPISLQSGWRRRQRVVPSGRESRLDRDRTRHECPEACVPRR